MAQLCPHCKNSTQFKAQITKAGIINLEQEDDTIIEKEGQKFVFEVKACCGCGEEVTNESLIDAHACKHCEEMIPDQELNEEGLCTACEALETRQDLNGLSQQALVRRLLELEAAQSTKKKEVKEKPQASVPVGE